MRVSPLKLDCNITPGTIGLSIPASAAASPSGTTSAPPAASEAAASGDGAGGGTGDDADAAAGSSAPGDAPPGEGAAASSEGGAGKADASQHKKADGEAAPVVYELNARVKARFHGGAFYEGRVVERTDAGVYTVMFDDGEVENDLTADQMQPLAAANPS